ncbi:MAG: DUF4372 domain-containing protein [Candidatus Omnitrophica bacterium]|nr:DUF4372 domain-containing protein [Candidatus Omnitrophota bacterium]
MQNLVSETKSEYHARSCSSRNHFVSMLFGQLAGHYSLRGIEAGSLRKPNIYII